MDGAHRGLSKILTQIGKRSGKVKQIGKSTYNSNDPKSGKNNRIIPEIQKYSDRYH